MLPIVPALLNVSSWQTGRLFAGKLCSLESKLLTIRLPMRRYFVIVVQLMLAKAVFCAATALQASESPAADPDAVFGVALSEADARHLLLRTGIGVAPGDLIRFTGMSRSNAINQIIDGMSPSPAVPMPSWTQDPVPHYFANNDFDADERQRFRRERDAEFSQLRQWWVLNILQTESPQTERMVLFWHDIFATNYYDLDRRSLAMARQNQTFREHGFGSWPLLLQEMIRDPALLRYLNADSNRKDAPNENLARELMELFSLGEGNFDEASVKEAARALTGRGVSQSYNLAFIVQPWQQDRGEKVLFGQRGTFDGDELVELIVEQDAAARFLATRFWNAFISDDPVDSTWLADASSRFTGSGHEIAALYRYTLESDAFWDLKYRGAIIKSPIDIIAGLARTLEFPKQHWRNFAAWHAELGLDLFAPRNVSGWKEGKAFVTPGKLLSRYATVDAMTQSVRYQQAGNSNMMVTNNMMPIDTMTATTTSMMSQSDNDPGLLLRMAAEDYRGPVRFQIALHRADAILWESEEQDFTGGHNTELFGRLKSVDSAAWQLKHFPVAKEILETVETIVIRFTNDLAGAGGDRNLYVDGVRIGEQWWSASYGTQRSTCVPQNQANAGNLHCAGELWIKRPEFEKANSRDLPDFRAGSAHVLWAKYNEHQNKLAASFALTDVTTPFGEFHNIHFGVEARKDGPMELRIDSFDCWPDCIRRWPECAWQNKHFKEILTLNFPLIEKPGDSAAGRDDWCHYDELSVDEQALVGALWQTLAVLFDTMQHSQHGKARFIKPLKALQQRLADNVLPLEASVFAASPSIVVNDAFIRPGKSREPLPEPLLLVQDATALEQALLAMNLSLDNLLLPGFEDPLLEAIATDESIPFATRLSRLLDAPVFQLR